MLPRCPRYLSLDAWRGIACLLVVVNHSTYYVVHKDSPPPQTFSDWLIWLTTKGWIGVPLFFVISGYCISAAADNTRIKGRSTWDYCKRRFRRIYPPLWIYLAAIGPIVLLLDLYWPELLRNPRHDRIPLYTMTLPELIGNLTLTETWRPVLFQDRQHYIIGQSWTLCYEEQFYFVFAAALLLCRSRMFQAMAAITLPILALAMVNRSYKAEGTFADGFWLDFAAGILVYVVVNYGSRKSALVALCLLAAGIAWQFTKPEGFVSFTPSSQQNRAVAFGFAMLLLLIHPFDDKIAKHPAVRPIEWCGTLCYSMYLVHWPAVRIISHLLYDAGATSSVATLLVTIPVCVAASILMGWGFHLLIERRFLNSPPVSSVVNPAAPIPSPES